MSLVAFSSSFDGHDEEGASELHDEVASDGHATSLRVNGNEGYSKDIKTVPRQMPTWLSNSTPDEFLVCSFVLIMSHISFLMNSSSSRF